MFVNVKQKQNRFPQVCTRARTRPVGLVTGISRVSQLHLLLDLGLRGSATEALLLISYLYRVAFSYERGTPVPRSEDPTCRGWRFLMSEVPLYLYRAHERGTPVSRS